MQLALDYSLISFILSVPHIEPFLYQNITLPYLLITLCLEVKTALNIFVALNISHSSTCMERNSHSIWGFTGFHLTIPGKVHIEAVSCEGSLYHCWLCLNSSSEASRTTWLESGSPCPVFSWHLISALTVAQNVGIIMKKPYLLLDSVCPGTLGSYAPHLVGEYY